MQDRIIEELELDLKELKFLLKEVEKEHLLIPITKRHLNRFIKSLEEIKSEVECLEKSAVINPEKTVSKEAIQDIVEEKHITIKETKISPEQVIREEIAEDTKNVIRETTVTSSVAVIGERLKPSVELAKGLSLNDTFRFSRELFGGDKEELSRILQEISRMDSLAEVTSYLSSQIKWDEEDDTIKDFVELLKKYFVQ